MTGVQVGEVDAAVTRALRRAVLRPGLGPDDPLPGDDRPDAVHLAALEAGHPVSTCLVQPDAADWVPGDHPPSTQWRLRSMATTPGRQGQGLGAAVLAAAVDAVARRGGRVLWAHARISAEPFYFAHGWQPDGAEFESVGVPHRHIWRQVDMST